MSAKFTDRYGARWPGEYDDLKIEFECIKMGGRWQFPSGNWGGIGLFHHYRNAQSLCWPEDDHHRWSDLGLKAIVENDVTVFLGSGDSNKTYSMVRWALIDFWVDPEKTLILVSSTDVRGLELRVWGKMKELLNRAKDLWDWLPGQVLESKYSITPDKIDAANERGRLLQRGIICIPCIQGGRYVGLGKYVGIKSPRLRHVGDEIQFMGASFLSAYANWFGKPNFKGVMAGNPLDIMDPLGKAAEPIDGWTSMPAPTKTATWRSRFFNAFVVNFVGTDSPNFDYPQDQPPRYDYLIGRKKLEAVAKTYGKDSLEWSSQCEGVMRPGLVGRRVITRELCRLHHAHDDPLWNGTSRTLIYACDPAYGGGDRCVGGWGEFGESSDGKPILCLHPPEIIPINLKLDVIPEDQIATYIKGRLLELGIPVENCFWDSFGKGTLGHSFATVFGSATPIPVDSGARPTKRPVRFDLFVEEDNGYGRMEKRLKRCDEHYSKFVTEMWFSVREIIQGDQMFGLPEDVMEEGCMREYCMVQGNKYELESKADTKERMGRSPDLMDFAAILCEGARQRGFKIQRLGTVHEKDAPEYPIADEVDKFNQIIQSRLLVHR